METITVPIFLLFSTGTESFQYDAITDYYSLQIFQFHKSRENAEKQQKEQLRM